MIEAKLSAEYAAMQAVLERQYKQKMQQLQEILDNRLDEVRRLEEKATEKAWKAASDSVFYNRLASAFRVYERRTEESHKQFWGGHLSNDPEQLKAREDARVKKWIAQEAEAKMQSLSESRERSAAQALVHKAFWEAVAKATTAQTDVGSE